MEEGLYLHPGDMGGGCDGALPRGVAALAQVLTPLPPLRAPLPIPSGSLVSPLQ